MRSNLSDYSNKTLEDKKSLKNNLSWQPYLHNNQPDAFLFAVMTALLTALSKYCQRLW